MPDAEKKERDAKRQESIKRVKQRLEEQAAVTHQERPLRRFGCKLVVALHHHTKGPGGGVDVLVKLVTMEDKIAFPKLHEWAETCLGLAKGKGKSLILQFFNDSGRGVIITDKWTLQSWLDQVRNELPIATTTTTTTTKIEMSSLRCGPSTRHYHHYYYY